MCNMDEKDGYVFLTYLTDDLGNFSYTDDFQDHRTLRGSGHEAKDAPTKWHINTESCIRIPLYTLIFLAGLVGNSLVIMTLARNRRLRMVTNIFLLNLAVSDLLLGVFCMPFTLIGTLLRQFIFGHVMCKIISYLQAVTVAVSAWTLVAISLERFYAVCEPLRSRRWQTSTHACKVITGIWMASFIAMTPIACVTTLLPIRPPGKYKCREKWPSQAWERTFNLVLDASLLAVPLVIMAVAYLRIGLVLRREIPENQFADQAAENGNAADGNRTMSGVLSGDECLVWKSPKFSVKWTKARLQSHVSSTRSTTVTSGSARHSSGCTSSAIITINSRNMERRLAIKKRVTCMLIIVVLEFFICWTPIYVINTISSFSPDLVYKQVGYATISFFHLLSYISSCCNPITYCFMNKNFRREFIQSFTSCCRCCQKSQNGPDSNGKERTCL